MERRSFFKGLIGIAVSLTPAGTIIQKLATLPEVVPQLAAIPEILSSKLSRPIIIKIANNTNSDIQDVDVFGAFQYLNHPPEKAEFISTNTESYREVLQMMMMNPFQVERTFVTVSNPKQLKELLVLTTFDANGNTAQMPLFPNFTPYDIEPDIIDIKTPYHMDGFTLIKIPRLLKQTWIEFRLYPAQTLGERLQFDNSKKIS